jgi:hypothetical protein
MKKNYIVTYRHPSVFYTSRHYGRMADRNLGFKVFNTEEAANAFAAEAKAHNATDISISIHD